jgi:hypothetical protein
MPAARTQSGVNTMRQELLLIGLLISASPIAAAEVSVGFNLSVFPDLVAVPGYPVYYAPNMAANYFSTMACTGFFRMTTGTAALGTTALGTR